MKKLLSFFVFFITFFALLNNANSVEQITYKDKKYEKLDFKEYGNFFGIKKNNNFYKGIFIGPKGEDGGQSDWYGFFTPKGAYHKGYFKHTYEDGRTLYQYTEYKLDETGEPFTIEENKFAISDQYLINEESFELVKKYLMYEIDMPYSFYNFEINKLETAEKNEVLIKEETDKENLKLQKVIYNNENPDGKIIDLTEEEVNQAELDKAESDRIVNLEKSQEDTNKDLKASAKAKLVAGEPLTDEEADTIVL